MALITIERIIPAPVQNSILLSPPEEQGLDKFPNNETTTSTDNILSEIYIAVRGADIIFPYNECHSFSSSSHKAIFHDIQKHLQAILKLLRPQDKMKMAVRLESASLSSNRTRYLLVVVCGADESCLLGIDYENEATIGLVLAIYNDMQISLDGDGGFRITSGTRHHIFKPVSVQAMWSAFQALHLATKKSVKNNYFEGGGSHSWVSYYHNRIKSNSFYLHEWHTITDASETTTTNKIYEFTNKPVEQLNFEELITAKLKKIMMSVDLEQVTSKEIRSELESRLGRDLTEFKSYIDKEMIRIMGQMDEASKILDYLYLGSEWNASNFEELKGKGVKKILNVTCEIDNFFPGQFEYLNVRVTDTEDTDMLRYLNDTYYYISKAKDEGAKVLVHCKKGISRSASVVVAYIMKEKSCNLLEALEYVKKLRSSIRPNPEFLKQLEIYQGMLKASDKSSTNVWRSNSESDLKDIFSKKSKSKNCDYPFSSRHKYAKQGKLSREDKENAIKLFPISHRRRSWPPKEGSQDSGYLLFSDKENRDNSRRSCFSRDYFLNDDTDIENLLSEISKSEIRSKVRDRISDFENFKTRNQILTKKNIANNGLVSNLATQFESKDKEAMNDLSNLEQYQRNSCSTKPPLPRPVKATFDIGCELCAEEKPMSQHSDLTLVFKSLSTRSEYSNRIMKRTLSCDHILDLCKNIDSTDVSLKKCKKSFPRNADDSTSTHRNNGQPLARTLSLPNITLDLLSFKQKINQNYSTLVLRQTAYMKSAPLDLHYIRAQLNKQINDSDGFVKRRTEELEKGEKEPSSKLNKSRSMPSSPNFHFLSSVIEKCPSNKGRPLHHSVSTKSFDFSMSAKCSFESGSLATDQKKSHKKTYGRSHPLDKLHRNA